MSVVSQTPSTATLGAWSGPAIDVVKLRQAVDSVPETRGLGIVIITDTAVQRVRNPLSGNSYVVFELRTRSLPAIRPAVSAPPRNADSSAPSEWLSLGFNCGGMVLSWVGVVGTAFVAPETGGASLAGTAILWGGALAGTAQCSASVYRVTNVARGREDINQSLDTNAAYVWGMRGADVIGLVGAGGAIKEIITTRAALKEAGIGWSGALAGDIARPQRRVLTEALELQGAKRVPAARIGAVVKQRLLDLTIGAVGMTGSAATGVIHDVVIWVASDPDTSKP